MSSPPASHGQHGEAPAYRPPKQERSRATLERILQAALEIMEERGVDGATVAAIVERADASVGSFYARFPGKGELVSHLRSHVWRKAEERWDEALAEREWSGRSAAEIVEEVASVLVHTLAEDHRSRQVLEEGGEEGESGDPGGADRARAFHRHVLETVIPLLRDREGEITHPDPDLAVDLGYRFVVGALREALDETGTTGQGPVEPGILIRELARLWTGYLAPPGPEVEAPRAEGDVDVFDPWG